MIKQRKVGSYKLILEGVEQVHWTTNVDDADEGITIPKNLPRTLLNIIVKIQKLSHTKSMSPKKEQLKDAYSRGPA